MGMKNTAVESQAKPVRKVSEITGNHKGKDESGEDKSGEDDSDEDEEDDSDSSDDSSEDAVENGVNKKIEHSSQGRNKKSNFSSQNGGLEFRTENPFQLDGVHSIGRWNNDKGKNDSVCSTDKKLARVLSYTAMTESQTSESEQDQESDSDSDSSKSEEEFVINESPSKVVTRKIAAKHPAQFQSNAKDYLNTSLNASAFIPSSKSPIVISREKVDPVKAVKEEAKFSYHSDTDSVGNRQNNSFSDDDDRNSEKNTKSSFGEKKTLHFDDDDEWADLTPKPAKSSNKRLSGGGENDLDKTLVEEPSKSILFTV